MLISEERWQQASRQRELLQLITAQGAELQDSESQHQLPNNADLQLN